MSVVRSFPRAIIRHRGVLGVRWWSLACSACGTRMRWTRSMGRASMRLAAHGRRSPQCVDLLETPDAQTRAALGLDTCTMPHIGRA